MIGLLIGICIGGIVGFLSCAMIIAGDGARNTTDKENENEPERVPSAHQED